MVKDLFSKPQNGGQPRTAGYLLAELFRCPEDVAAFAQKGELSSNLGFFRLGSDTLCYGQCSSGQPAIDVSDSLHDALDQITIDNSVVQLPFDPVQVLDCLRLERYSPNLTHGFLGQAALRALYYAIRPALGVSVRRHLQKLYFRGRDKIAFPQVAQSKT